LEQLLTRIATGIEGNTTSVQAQQASTALDRAEWNKTLARIDRKLDEHILLAISNLGEAIHDFIEAQKAFAGPLTDARRALDEGARAFRETTQKVAAMSDEPPSKLPKWYRTSTRWFAELAWEHKGRVIGAIVFAVAVWFKAAPAVIAAIKLLTAGE
jgi:hypothetical protein